MFYFIDIGIRNERINFRLHEGTHIMENIIYNELLFYRLDVDVGVVGHIIKDNSEKRNLKQLERNFLIKK